MVFLHNMVGLDFNLLNNDILSIIRYFFCYEVGMEKTIIWISRSLLRASKYVVV